MTQDECLSTPSHWTHYGVCYPGSNATIQLHGITIGGTGSHSVPEPSTFALFAIAAVVAFMFNRFPRLSRRC